MWKASMRLVSNIKAYYKEINAATLSGANDVVVIEQPDGSLVCSPFSVRFGKLGVMRYNATEVYVEVNGEACDLTMVLSSDGEAFFPTAPADAIDDQEPDGLEECLPVENHGRLVRVFSDSDLYAAKRGQCSEASSSVTPQGGVFEMDMQDADAGLAETKDAVTEAAAFQEACQHSVERCQGRHRHVTGEEAVLCTSMPKMALSALRDESKLWSVENADAVCNEYSSSYSGDREQWLRRGTPVSLLCTPVMQHHIQANPSRGEADGACAGASRSRGVGTAPVFQVEQKVEHYQQKVSEQGIYLDDLDLTKLTPEQTALYFPKSDYKLPERRLDSAPSPNGLATALSIKCCVNDEDDAESGRGTSHSQSPMFASDLATSPVSSRQLSRPGSPSGNADLAAAEHGHPYSVFGDVSLSLCGGLKDGQDGSGVSIEKFQQHLVTFDDFCKDPGVLDNPNLVVRLHGRFVHWRVAAAVLVGMAAYHSPLPTDVIETLTRQHMPPKPEERKKGTFFSSWWGRQKEDSPAKETLSTPAISRSVSPQPPQALATQAAVVPTMDAKTQMGSPPNRTLPEASAAPSAVVSSDCHSKTADVPLAASCSAGAGQGNPAAFTVGFDSGNEADDERAACSAPRPERQLSKTQWRKKTPTTEQLKQLRLQPGQNEIEFSVTTALQGTTRCMSHIYLWKWTDRIIVSDIDGTITKSDVLGQLLPMVGKDWSQVDVVKLYTKMAENGYKFVYLSARAIGQSQMTRDFLQSVRQHKATLPPGPLFLSPTSLYTAFRKEVIERKPEEFKISCLRNLKSLFPSAVVSPIYAGFGNKINDVWAYRAVDIPISRVFTINTKGEVKSELSQTFRSSYSKLSDVVDHFFPPVTSLSGAEHLHEASDYSSFIYWREPVQPLPDATLEASSQALPRATRQASAQVLPSAKASPASGTVESSGAGA